MSDSAACCSHLHVSYLTSTSGAITTGWWACDYCGTKFVPAGLHNLIVAEVARLRAELAEAKRIASHWEAQCLALMKFVAEAK